MKNALIGLMLALTVSGNTVSGNSVEYFFAEPEPAEVTMVVAGDNLIHSTVISSGKQSDGSYDYTEMYSEISDYIANFDLRVINQETPLINDPSRYSGYPMFGSPLEIGEAVVDAGFNIVTHATNHTVDKGLAGIEDSLEFWRDNKVTVLGMRDKPYDSFIIREVDGISIGMCNFTYGLNGLRAPDGNDWMIDDLNNDQLVSDTVKNAQAVCDVVVVFTHWGNEYVYEPTDYQCERAQLLIDSGADVIIGTHPHVIQPLEYIGDVPVFWSIGNFISAQDEVPRMLGALAEITITEDGVVEAKATPVVTHIETYSKWFKTYLLEDYTPELASTHRLRRVKGEAFSIEKLNELWETVMGD